MTHDTLPPDLQTLLDDLSRLADRSNSTAEEDTPAALLVREFLKNSWNRCEELLGKCRVLRVRPELALGVFGFEIDCPYRRKRHSGDSVELMLGPVRGRIHYRLDMFANPGQPYIAVQIDSELAYFHPNCSRQRGSLLCLGEIPPSAFPFGLDLLVETHLYPIVTYQNRRPAHPCDEEAARYFALAPEAMEGLEPVKPLY